MSWVQEMRRHWAVVRSALADDKARRALLTEAEEVDFLPAALEAIERPVSPTARASSWLLMAGLAVTLAWLVIGKVDVVASAPGRILPGGNSKLVQSAGSGVIGAIHVSDGDHVKQSQPLIDLDPTLATAEFDQARKALLTAQLEVARNQAFVAALDGRGVRFAAPEGTPPDVAVTQTMLVRAQLAELDTTVAGYGAARASAQADAQAATATREKVDGTLPILDHELEAMNRLDAKGYAPGMRLLELQRQRRAEAGDRDVAVAQEARGQSEARRYGEAMAEARAQARRQALTDLAKAEADAIVRQEDVTKAARRSSLQRLVAPVDGTVQQLAVHTIGGVVEPARTLMVIVPDQHQIEVEAQVLNRDAGFVHEGQAVAVKVDAYPFTRYGTLPGRVVSLSRDAVPDRQLGATFTARIRLDRSSMMVDGKPVALTPGLGVTADIRTGSRRIISWLISPLTTSIEQAARER